MNKPTKEISLQALLCLERVLEALRLAGEEITQTKLRNSLGVLDTLLISAIDYGVKYEYLERKQYGYVKFKREFVVQEEHYYETISAGLETLWRSDGYKDENFYLETTARKGSKIEGPWSRPDFTLVCYKRFAWTIGYEFDVVTFEAKKPDTCNVLAVFEALSHASAATRAYVVFPLSAEEWKKKEPQQEQRVREECTRHGVGLILMENVREIVKPKHLIKARRREIDHEKCSRFLGAVLSSDGREKIATWKQ